MRTPTLALFLAAAMLPVLACEFRACEAAEPDTVQEAAEPDTVQEEAEPDTVQEAAEPD